MMRSMLPPGMGFHQINYNPWDILRFGREFGVQQHPVHMPTIPAARVGGTGVVGPAQAAYSPMTQPHITRTVEPPRQHRGD
jgi:hypothetical protein